VTARDHVQAFSAGAMQRLRELAGVADAPEGGLTRTADGWEFLAPGVLFEFRLGRPRLFTARDALNGGVQVRGPTIMRAVEARQTRAQWAVIGWVRRDEDAPSIMAGYVRGCA